MLLKTLKVLGFRGDRRATQPRFAPHLVSLEDRCTPATFTVTNLNDSGPGSLRQAVADANALAGADIVAFDPGVTGTIALTTGEISITGALSIAGPGSSKLTVSGGEASRIISTVAAPLNTAIDINGLTLTKGKASVFDDGGAIVFDGQLLTIRNCRITESRITGSNSKGGAIADGGSGGSLRIEDSELSDNTAYIGGAVFVESALLSTLRTTVIRNTAYLDGGGIAANFLTMDLSTIAENMIDSKNQPGNVIAGAGLYVKGPTPIHAIITNSTISQNTAMNGKSTDGIHLNYDIGGIVTIRNTSISGNNSLGGISTYGGGVTISGNGNGVATGTLTIQNCTITDNYGSGINAFSNDFTAMMFTMQSTIVAGNTSSSGNPSAVQDLDFDLVPIVIAGNNNLIGVLDASNKAMLTGVGNLTGTLAVPLNPVLAALADNGGLTKTHALLDGSPALNAGNNAAGLATDQRGYFRTSGSATDIGAFERTTGSLVTNTNDSGAGSLRQAILNVSGGDVQFDPFVFASPQTITLTSGAFNLPSSRTIIGPAGKVTIDAGNLGRIFNAQPAAANSKINLRNLILANGNAGANEGGAIFGNGFSFGGFSVTVTNCEFTGNTAFAGGAIGILSGTLTIEDSSFVGNSASNSGGAISARFTGMKTFIRRSSISGNTSSGTAGGVFINGSTYQNGISLIENSTISNNTSKSAGGGLLLTGNANTIRNSTISGNTALGGGGINTNGTVVIQNSTIVNNTATQPTNAGGGISAVVAAPSIFLESSILSKNSAPNGIGNATDIYAAGTVTSTTSSIFNSVGIASFNDLGGNRPFGEDPLIGTLANNGGSTKTHALLPGSPLINNGSNPAMLTLDQRGLPYFGTTDIGSYERQQTRITGIVLDDYLLGDANVGPNGFTVTATFDAPMNTSVQPVLSFPVEAVVGSLSFASGTWLDSTHWVAKYGVADASTNLPQIDIAISSGPDADGFAVLPFSAPNAFHIDTMNAVVSSITSTTPNGNYGAGQAINITLNFTESVTLTGSLLLTLDTDAVVTMFAQEGNTLSATYTVAPGQMSPDLNVTALSLVGGSTLLDAAGNATVLALPPGSLAMNSDIVVNAPQPVTGLVVNGGDVQRSRITTIQVNFANPVEASLLQFAGQVTLTRTAGGPGTVVNNSNGLLIAPFAGLVSSITLTFANVINDGVESGSLEDGRWQLAIPSIGYTSPLNDINLRRLYGDSNNDGNVDGVDFITFGNDFNSPSTAFDFNADGVVNGIDLLAFGNQFNLNL